MRCKSHACGHTFISDFKKFDLWIDERRVLVEKLPEQLLLQSHVCRWLMISRVAYHHIFNVGSFVDVECIVKFIQIFYFRRIHHKLEGDGTILIVFHTHWHFQSIFIYYNMWYTLPLLNVTMYSEGLSKYLLSVLMSKKFMQIQFIDKQWLTFLPCKPFQLVVLRVQLICVSYLDEVIAVLSEKSFVLKLLRSEKRHWVFSFFGRFLRNRICNIGLLCVFLFGGLSVLLSHHKFIEEEVSQFSWSVNYKEESHYVLSEISYSWVVSEIILSLVLSSLF